MSSSHRRQGSSQSTSSGHSHQQSHDSFESHLTHSTAPTSLYSTQDHYFSDHKTMGTSTRADEDLYTPSSYYHSKPKPYVYQDDVSPATSLYPRSSVETYASTTSSSQDLDAMDDDESPVEAEDVSIPPLPTYRRELVEPNVRATTPQDFAKLFPSLNRLSIRHDEYTSDGNMNLRIDTVVTGRRRTVYQLFHLRMYDLAKREFSLRRYCRDSGREVCNSKRKYAESSASVKAKSRATSRDDVNTSKSHHERPTLKRSMSTAIKTLSAATKSKPVLRRTTTSGTSSICSSRPNTSDSCYGGDELCRHSNSSRTSLASKGKGKGHRAVPTNTIKLEFSNYARVDVHRRGGKSNKRYEFEWWGHNYAWKRSVDKQMGGQVSFHLIRDGNTSAPVAHIVPETRSPAQVDADERAGGWVPPCFMWIADETIIDAVTDVADVIMASGLMALVDDCIKEKWQTSKKVHRIPLPLTHRTVSLPSIDASPRSIMQHVFGRRHSQTQSHQPTPMRLDQPIAAC